MCKALEDIYNDGVQDGMEQGRRSGIAEGEAHGKELGIASQKKEVALQMQKAWLSFGCHCSGTDGVSG